MTVPGLLSPSAGFEQPFEMLAACHERVERILTLLEKLQQYLPTHGADEQARQAARDVMRYFDLAAPLHHQDEEIHVFPPLLAGPDEAVAELVRRLQQDHRQMEADWVHAKVILQAVVEGLNALDADQTAALKKYAALYQRHLQDENGIAYPAAVLALSNTALHAMSEDMMRRRGVVPQASDAIKNISNY